MTYHVKLEKKTGILSQAVDTSEKLKSVAQELSWIYGSTLDVSLLSLRTISVQIHPEGAKKA